MARSNSKQAQQVVAEVCLYGTRLHGYGWLGQMADGTLLGDTITQAEDPWRAGEVRLVEGTMTERIFAAVRALAEDHGVRSGLVRVYEPEGIRFAIVDLARPRNVGDLTWERAGGFEVSAEAIIAAASTE